MTEAVSNVTPFWPMVGVGANQAKRCATAAELVRAGDLDQLPEMAGSMPAFGNIDLPEIIVPSGVFDVRGWMVDDNVLETVTIYIDDTAWARSDVFLARPDIARKYPERPGAARSGFVAKSCIVPKDQDFVRVVVLGRGPAGRMVFLERTVPVLHDATGVATAFRARASRSSGWPGILADVALRFAAQGAVADAELVAALAMARFPKNVDVLAAYARIEERAVETGHGDSLELLRRWQAVTARRADSLAGLAGELRTLVRLKRWEDVNTLAGSAVVRFPRSQRLREFAMRAATATIASDIALEMIDATALEREAVQLAAGTVDRAATQALMARFEALGHNCTFGAVQRYFGAEPLGLLRFAGAPIHKLISALDSRFAGLGDPEHTVLEVRPHPRPEFWVADRRFDFSMHTFIYPDGEFPEDEFRKLHRKNCQRLAFLARKLIEDLEAGAKILVHQDARGAKLEDLIALKEAVGRYGSGTLLCVVPGDGPKVELNMFAPGMLLGTSPGFDDRAGVVPDYGRWLELLNRTSEMVLTRTV